MTVAPRMQNPALVVPGAFQPIQALVKAVQGGGVPQKTLELVHLRTSQINGCGFCVDFGTRNAKKHGETDQRLHAVAAWRESPYFDDAERAALALAEHETRLADRPDPVPDHVWEDAAKHYDERGLGALVLMIAATNLFNRIGVTTKQPADPNVTL
ncbi:carboxymuconolactone decarboxylase family protein [Streptomyces sp. NPDC048172]|uniref:carboxymuconolactone decarboxylase family protein n=1 Tax=Streptomyces sp. NPDC048172 TaxID=3365505 RepID=UPI00371284C1